MPTEATSRLNHVPRRHGQNEFTLVDQASEFVGCRESVSVKCVATMHGLGQLHPFVLIKIDDLALAQRVRERWIVHFDSKAVIGRCD